MSLTYPVQSLRAENLGGNYEPTHCDYPIALLTRRRFAMAEGHILATRSSSPLHVDCSQPVRWSSRPPC